MKLVAARDFYNSKPLGVTVDPKDPLFVHAAQIHKGLRFTIGDSDNFKELNEAQRFQTGTLIKYGLAVLDCAENVDKGVIKKIDAEAKLENEARKRAQAKQMSLEEIIAAAVAKSVAEVLAATRK